MIHLKIVHEPNTMRKVVGLLICTLIHQVQLSCVTFTQCTIDLKQTMVTYKSFINHQISKKEDIDTEIRQRTFEALDDLNSRILDGPPFCESYYVVRYKSAAKNISEVCEEMAAGLDSLISDGGFPVNAIVNNNEAIRALYCNDQVRKMNEYCDYVRRVMEDFYDCDVIRLVNRYYAEPWIDCLKLILENA